MEKSREFQSDPYVSSCRVSAYVLDTLSPVETPEGIELHLRPAGVVSRSLAYTIDFGIRLVIFSVVSFVVVPAGEFGFGILLIVYFLLEWIYPVLFEVLANGATPGKKMMGLWVVNDDGTPISWSSSMLRNIFRAADFLPFMYSAGLITMACSSQFRRLGDIVAGTLVVYHAREESRSVPDSQGSRPVPMPLSKEEQLAVVAFRERESVLSTGRRQELADILVPVLAVPREKAVTELDKIANGLMGGS